MPTLNKIILIGYLGKDPEVTVTSSGKTRVKLSLATSEHFKDKSGEWQEWVDWHTIILWDKVAEYVAGRVAKGDLVYVEGRMSYRHFDTGDRTIRTAEVIAYKVLPLAFIPDEEGEEESEEVEDATHDDAADDDAPF